MIHIAQWSEHNYVGVKCGIMDQFTSMMGKKDHVMVLDCQSLAYNYFPLKLEGHCLLLCDTNVKHSLASSEYNTRRRECEEGVRILKSKYPEINSLREVGEDILTECRDLFPGKVYERCLYVVQENLRVLKGSEDLQYGKLREFGEKMFATHTGLSVLYEVSCKELDFLVDQAKNFSGVLGSRMMGGGFGGCTISIVQESLVGEFASEVANAYKSKFNIEMSPYLVRTGNGTSVVENLIRS